MVEKRLFGLSPNETIFNGAALPYQEALRKCGYTHQLKYVKPIKKVRNRKRKNILWFNPPYSQSVKTNIGKEFLSLIDKHFPSHNKYTQIFNRKLVKVSYCTVSNVGNIINKHNRNLILGKKHEFLGGCNCRIKGDCPLDGKCKSNNLVYRADVLHDNHISTYYGLSEPTFKLRYADHLTSFRYRKHMKKTSLSKFVWSLKDNNISYDIKWSISRFAPAHKNGSKSCCLCLAEKIDIAYHTDKSTLINSRSEIMNKCRHKSKFKLINT